MKKINLSVMICIVIFIMVGCTSKDTSSNKLKNVKDEGILTIGEKFIVEDYAEITIKGVEVNNKIEPPKLTGYSLTYESDETDKTYVSVIAEVKNLTDTEIPINKIANVSVNKDQSKYVCNLYLQLTEDDTSLDEFQSIAPLSSNTIYCGTKVPKNSLGESVINFIIKDKTYSLNYNTTSAPIEKKSITLGQKLIVDEYAELIIEDIEYKEDVLPSKPGDFSTHYQVEDSSNVYIDVITKVKNLRSSSYEAEKFFGAKAIYDRKYNYNGFIVGEELDGSTLETYLSIDPLSTMTVHALIEVPKEAMAGEVELCIYFSGNNYFITLDKE